MQVSLATLKSQLVAIEEISGGVSVIEEEGLKNRTAVTETWLNDLYFELQIMSHQPLCEHPNIVQLEGISFIDHTNEDIYPLLIVEPACRDFPDLTRLLSSRSASEIWS